MMIAGTSKQETVIGVDHDSSAVDETRLIERARSDPDAFVGLYRRHYDWVFRYCVHRLFERQTAEDATSQVFLKAVEHFGGFKGDGRQFRRWLYRVATNVVNEHLRTAVRRERLLSRACRQRNIRVVGGQSTAESPDCKTALLREAILSLSPKYQTIITLRFFENMKLTEIAELLGRSAGTVRSQLGRALAKLRRQLGRADGRY